MPAQVDLRGLVCYGARDEDSFCGLGVGDGRIEDEKTLLLARQIFFRASE